MTQFKEQREFLKSDWAPVDAGHTGQRAGLERPPLTKPYDVEAKVTPLPQVTDAVVRNHHVFECLRNRRSRRKFTPEAFNLAELGFMLWATQGVDEVLGDNQATLRRVPSAGARHPLETYLVVNRVAGLQSGLYQYLPLEHALLAISVPHNDSDRVKAVLSRDTWALEGAVLFFWACIPARAEWRYGPAAHKMILLDTGHAAQNLYWACEALGCGVCVLNRYDQQAADALFDLDGNEEFTVYLASVGKLQ